MDALLHPAGLEADADALLLRRRELLAGLAALPLLLLSADSKILPTRRPKIDPEPLHHFAGLAEGFYRAGASVYYLDEFAATWAPPGLRADQLLWLDAPTAETRAELLADLRQRRWAWAVEHAVLLRLDSDRDFAVALLTEAVARNPVLRLADLLALLLLRTAPYRLDPLLVLPATRPLAERVARWRSPAWGRNLPETPVWRSPGTDGAVFTSWITRR